MKLIIDIQDFVYNNVKEFDTTHNYELNIVESINNGTPLVQCKDCQFWEQQKNSLQGRCCLLQIYPTGRWYCANAQKKENKE